MKRRPRAPVLALALLAAGCDRGSHPRQPGMPAPDFTVADGSTRVHLAGLRGRVVLLNFWATWCPPCVEETPSLLALHHAMPGIEIVAISIDEDPDAYRRFLERFHVDFTTVRDPGQSVARKFTTQGWPETYIIDRQGVIRRKFVGPQDWQSPEILAYLGTL